jgi:PAS domain S-box-containing protein
VVIADCGMQITSVNEGFSAITGYSASEAVGRNCRFLQGPDTDRRAVAAMSEALRARRAIRLALLNYRKDGTPFWNLLYLAPLFDEFRRRAPRRLPALSPSRAHMHMHGFTARALSQTRRRAVLHWRANAPPCRVRRQAAGAAQVELAAAAGRGAQDGRGDRGREKRRGERWRACATARGRGCDVCG